MERVEDSITVLDSERRHSDRAQPTRLMMDAKPFRNWTTSGCGTSSVDLRLSRRCNRRNSRRTGCTRKHRQHDQRIPAAAFYRMRNSARDDTERSRSDDRRLFAKAHGALTGDDVQEFVEIGVFVLGDRIAQLQQPRCGGRRARQHRFFERIASNVILVEE